MKVLDKINRVKELPEGVYDIVVYDCDNNSFIQVNTITMSVVHSCLVRLPCNCCSDYENTDRPFEDINEEYQLEILLELVENYMD